MQTTLDFSISILPSSVFHSEHALDTLQSCLFLYVQKHSVVLAPVSISRFISISHKARKQDFYRHQKQMYFGMHKGNFFSNIFEAFRGLIKTLT